MTDCAALGLQLAEASDRTSRLSDSARAHVDRCLRCQAELVAYRKLHRSLAGLRSVTADLPPRQLDELLALFNPDAPIHPLRRGARRRAYIGGVAAAITAAGAGAVVLAARLTSRSALAG